MLNACVAVLTTATITWWGDLQEDSSCSEILPSDWLTMETLPPDWPARLVWSTLVTSPVGLKVMALVLMGLGLKTFSSLICLRLPPTFKLQWFFMISLSTCFLLKWFVYSLFLWNKSIIRSSSWSSCLFHNLRYFLVKLINVFRTSNIILTIISVWKTDVMTLEYIRKRRQWSRSMLIFDQSSQLSSRCLNIWKYLVVICLCPSLTLVWSKGTRQRAARVATIWNKSNSNEYVAQTVSCNK